jgi:hypothetical protein
MTNNSKQIYDLLMASKRLTPTFAQALHKHPNAKRFSIIATKSEHVFTFVPAHLERFAPSDAKLASINRPKDLTEKAIAQQIYRTCGALFNQMQPSLMFNYKIDELMARSFRFTWFSQVSDLVDRSTALDQNLRDRANDLYIRYVDAFMANTQTFLDKANKQGLDLDDNSPLSNVSYTMSQDGTDVFVSVCNGMELSDPEDVWDWLGITPEQLDSLKPEDQGVHFKRLRQLVRYTQLIVHVMRRANGQTRRTPALMDDIKRLTVDIIRAEKITKHSRQ